MANSSAASTRSSKRAEAAYGGVSPIAAWRARAARPGARRAHARGRHDRPRPRRDRLASRAALLYALGMPLDFYNRIEIGQGSISTISLGAGGIRVLTLSDRPRLPSPQS